MFAPAAGDRFKFMTVSFVNTGKSTLQTPLNMYLQSAFRHQLTSLTYPVVKNLHCLAVGLAFLVTGYSLPRNHASLANQA